MERRWVSRWSLAGLSALNVVLLLKNIGTQSLWLDEVTSLTVAKASLPAAARFFRQFPEQHPLYYIILKAWLLLGSDEATLRGLSAIFAGFCVWAVFGLGARLYDEDTGLVAAALMAVSPFMLYYGQEARMYSLLGLLSIVATSLLFCWCASPRGRYAAGYVTVAIAGLYTHFFFGFLLIAHLAWAYGTRRGWRTLLGLQALAAVAYAPWAILILTHPPAQQSWKGIQNVVFGLPYTLLRFSLGYSELIANVGWKQGITGEVIRNAPLLFLSCLGFGTAALLGLKRAFRMKGASLLVGYGLLIPPVLAIGLSGVVILVGERYLMVSYPFYVLAVAGGITQLGARSRQWPALALAATVALVTGHSLYRYYFDGSFGKEQWREVAAFVQTRRQPGDVVVIHRGYLKDAFTYYWRRFGTELTLLSSDDDVTSATASSRVWIVVSHAPDYEPVERTLALTHEPVCEQLFPHETGIRVVLMTRREAGGHATAGPLPRCDAQHQ